MRYRSPALGAAFLFAMATLSSQASDIGAETSAAKIAAGASLYDEFCARCHGVQMRDPEDTYFDLRAFPADQRSRFMNSVTNGKNSMPPWRSVLSEEEIDNLFAYVIAGGEKK